MRLRLLSTWSAYAKEPGPLPDLDLRLVEHQQKVWEALTRPQGPTVVFDIAMTGDGKTLAALLPLVQTNELGKGVFAYPTNELIRDQTGQVHRWLRTLKRTLEVAYLDATSLAAYAESIEQPKHEALRDYAAHYDLVLTNPDILHLLQRFHYVPKHHPAARLAQTWMNRFRYLVFDEFHVFDAPQVASVLDGIAFIRANQNEDWPNRFLFLSATPNDLLLNALKQAGISYEVIQGRYAHGLQNSAEHRLILHEVDLELVEQASGGIEAWVHKNLEVIRQFFADHPGSRGLLICNSVVTAKRLAAQLREALARDSITVGEITGLTGPEVRKTSLDADLIVATSAVDVGVDFRINLLIFESLDAGTFIQRLGRLGRHPGFATYKAIALVAPWAYERFKKCFANGAVVNREEFYRAVHKKVYQVPNRFERYLKRWGTVLSAVRKVRLSKQRHHYQTLLERYDREVSRLIAPPDEQRLRALLQEHKGKEIVKELERFRGAGRLDVWVHDPHTGAVTQMGLLRVLSATKFELIEREEAQKISEKLEQPFYPNELGLYAVIQAYLEERESIVLRYGGYLSSLPLNQAKVRSGFEVEARTPALQEINRKLRPLPLVTCVADPACFDLKSLRRRFRPPPLFELYNVKDLSGVAYPIAFGLDALLLDSVLFWRKEYQS
ncbi:type I-D CRISPR-associated helicase Cas3' [Thermus scotoductus]|uniref:Type I-D CRISPR-associated helicase Cas3 n=1 Tax=Thermus scotoductus TaxID=37636 RepID=A0A430UYX2_THESC|nr:type I-D CRISPR-associated helicase Cas3' [Thermus scotoductus]RTH98280.1 type I-D CRISPR-associated helicase Cas3' [Thermus scotoductus]RTI14729.1 type I-D CRISPR-associated helicase Cas3' [Thermus scotoductus]